MLTCCCLPPVQGIPIHLWDAVSGQLRCSYRGYDDADEPTPAFSLVLWQADIHLASSVPSFSGLRAATSQCMLPSESGSTHGMWH